MTGKDAIQRTRAFRRDLLTVDSQARSELWRQWVGSRRIIEDEAYRLSQRIIESGEATTGQWMRAERYQQMLEAIDAETVKYTRKAKHTSVQVQEWAGAQSVVDSKALLTAPALELGLTFSSPPREAIIAATGRLKTVHGSRLFADVSKQATSRVTDAIIYGIGAGKGPVAIARDVGRAGDIAGYRAQRIARTETMWAYREGQRYTYGQNPEVVLSWRWEALVGDPNTCPICIGMHGTVHPATAPFTTHVACVTGDTLVSSADIEKAFRSRYEGPVIDLATTSGHRLTVTPNHPILTNRGWVAADLLREGDEIVCRAGSDGGRGPDDYKMPSRIDEVFRTLAMSDGVPSAIVPTSPVDFHGDAVFGDGYVDVVNANGLLGNDLQTTSGEQFREEPFVVTDVGSVALPSEGGLGAMLERVRSAANSVMRGLCVPHVLLFAPCGHHQPVRFGASARVDTLGTESPVDGCTTHAETLRDGVHGLARKMRLNDVLDVHGNRPAPFGLVGSDGCYLGRRPQLAPLSDEVTQAEVANVELARAIIDGESGPIRFERIVQRTVRSFSGHVYNLQTRDGWYSANDIVTHNCRCSQTPVTPSWAELGFTGIADTGLPYDRTGVDRFARMPASDQQRILGPSRFDAYQSGVGLRDMIGTTHHPIWGSGLRLKPVSQL